MFRKATLILVSTFVLSSPVFSNDPPNPFVDVFSAEIYDQHELVPHFKSKEMDPSSLEDHELNQTILQLCLSKKIKALEKNLFEAYDRKIKDLKVLMEKYEPSKLGKVFKTAGGVLSTGTSLALFGVMPAAGAAKIAVGTAGVLATMGAGISGINEFLQPNGELDLDKMSATLERKKRDLILKLTQEPLFDLEAEYILKKRFYEPELQKKIEGILLSTRKSGGLPLDFKRGFLETCLNLPLQKKILNPDLPQWNLLSEKDVDTDISTQQDSLQARRNAARKRLLRYNKETRKEIQKIISQILYSSNSEVPSSRRFYYISGSPGLGKSRIPVDIAEFLGLPHFEKSIRSAQDLSELALEGGDWERDLANAGHLVQALTTGVQERESDKVETFKIPIMVASKYSLPPEMTLSVKIQKAKVPYKNTMFTLNDFDRLLLDPQTSTLTLAFILDYLDPTKLDFFSRYFKANVSTKDMPIIITANHKIPDEKRFEALKDRVVEIEVKAFEESSKEEILSEFYQVTAGKYGITNNNNARTDILNSTKGIDSIRNAQKIIEGQLLDSIATGTNRQPIEGQRVVDRAAETSSMEQVSVNGLFIPEAYPPSFTDTSVRNKVKTLEEISKATLLLFSDKEAEQFEGTQKILGTSGRTFNTAGLIDCLWQTKSSPRSKRTYNEQPMSLGALANRMHRFEFPQQKYIVFQYHLQLIQAMTDALLKFKKGSYIHSKILDDPLRLENILFLSIHLQNIIDLDQKDICEEEKLNEESKWYLKSYVAWYGDTKSGNTKSDELGSAFYKTPPPSLIPLEVYDK